MIAGTSAAVASHGELIERIAALAREKFAGRADYFNREFFFKEES